ncbi:Sugar transferase involved in LPS biosynthesis (colanic, teichoic acid) [Marinomonas polaris DSM 16579]|uniref:Sugar transferase involved in LPS biosynthesis (Colanic, teichoic acid) n=1 Tax=Marinomonas polaris DSM 16579 TaxID=1122206 RepID=A0A1M5MFC8_9GAMM|nr:sugar transferase [Marinomonas polaris]SHG75413.1 Sugar transferase involved in LPS biosynthesis (colanic, teichoic acid) [Marinomonas polaris DSM 16579]
MAKRCFDFFCSIIALVLLSPLFLIVAIWIKSDSKGPVFFRQKRVGRNGILFEIHKFRTMCMNTETFGQLTIGKDSRITSSGLFLRKSKVDELPQLIDVFLGNMSLVGPRPEVPEFMDYYPEDIKKRVLSVRPGITDRASIEMVDENEVLGRYSEPRQAYIDVILPLKQKHYLDYVEKNNLAGDLKIIFDTICKIIRNF